MSVIFIHQFIKQHLIHHALQVLILLPHVDVYNSICSMEHNAAAMILWMHGLEFYPPGPVPCYNIMFLHLAMAACLSNWLQYVFLLVSYNKIKIMHTIIMAKIDRYIAM